VVDVGEKERRCSGREEGHRECVSVRGGERKKERGDR
jgi:hypothetical protein